MKILRLPSNTKGRDLVIGDIHGHYDDFRRLLDEAEFNPSIDRVLCTGDLVDRGPDSFEECAERGEIEQATLGYLAQQISWNRGIANLVSRGTRLDSMHEGLSITFCGHNTVPEPVLAMSHYHLDTGSGLQQRHGRDEYGLTMAIVENGFPVSTLTTKEYA